MRPKGKLETGYTRCKQSGCVVFRVRKNPIRFPVTMAKGIHLFPYRTQKLSLSAPMVLGWRRPGRVGRCRIPQRKSLRRCLGLFLCASRQILLPDCFQANVQHCTWLGSTMCAASGGFSMGAMPGRVGGKARKKLCASVTFISPVVFNECATLYLVRIFSAARCAGFRQEKSLGRVGRC